MFMFVDKDISYAEQYFKAVLDGSKVDQATSSEVLFKRYVSRTKILLKYISASNGKGREH